MSDILFLCELCEEGLRAEEERAGHILSCPRCGASVKVPNSSMVPVPARRVDQAFLDTCMACGGQVSRAAPACPHCGHPLASIRAEAKLKQQQVREKAQAEFSQRQAREQICGSKKAWLVVLVIAAAVGIWLFATPSGKRCWATYWSYGPGGEMTRHDAQAEAAKAGQAQKLEARTTHQISGDHWFGCTSRSHFSRLVGLATSGDTEAFQQALNTGLATGSCTTFQTGEIVYLIDVGVFSGLAKIRRKGETKEYWTNMEAVK